MKKMSELKYEIIKIYQQTMIRTDCISLEEELDWDSFDKMQFVLQVEEVYGICLDEKLFDIVQAKKLCQIIEIIENSIFTK